jgi:hypothetical protein
VNSIEGGLQSGSLRQPGRDQNESAFSTILNELVQRVRGSLAAVLVDGQGESVDYGGVIDPFASRLAGAHWQIVLSETFPAPSPGRSWLAVGTLRRSYIACVLPEGYALVVILARTAAFARWDRAVAVCIADLCTEAGWTGMPLPEWFAVDVVCLPDGRPHAIRVDDGFGGLEILGVVATDLDPRERGWRVRLKTGAETTLVREAWGHWYADEPVSGRREPPPK